ncbi:MAG: HPr family phosphocarrier protein [Gammaproteobacteria bacterium]|nr:HPr family phosphocarrier protein [Gammaproteobacteria bacterium]
MISEHIEITNKLGLHARAAAKLVKLCGNYHSTIELEKGDQRVDAKSIMGVMMLAASQGSVLNFYIEGEDEQQAKDALVALINNRFDEPD